MIKQIISKEIQITVAEQDSNLFLTDKPNQKYFWKGSDSKLNFYIVKKNTTVIINPTNGLLVVENDFNHSVNFHLLRNGPIT